MSWGTELWDQGDAISTYTHEGIDFAITCSKFVKERSRIEIEYGNALRKIVKQFQHETKKEKKNEEISTALKSWNVILTETDDIAKQHELIGETLAASVCEPLKTIAKDISAERKKHLAESARLQANLKKAMDDLDKVKKNYERCCKEAEVAKQAFDKADKDMNMTKAQVDKFRTAWQQKSKAAEDANVEYQIAVEKTNQARRTHYNKEMPEVFDQLQKLEEDRVGKLGKIFVQYSEVERSSLPIITTCLNNVLNEANSINPARDSQLFISDNKSGFAPPADIQYQEFGSKTPAPPVVTARNIAASPSIKKKGTGLFGKKKKEEEKDDYSNLPPEKRKKKFAQRIQEIESDIQKESKKKESLENMIKLYTAQPNLADDKAMSEAKNQLAESAKSVAEMEKELYKFQLYLSAMESSPSSPAPKQQFSRAESSSSVLDDDDNSNGPEQQCRTLYAFEASGEGELSVAAGETLSVIENDGSGWVRVARGDDEGYVPESYIEII